MPTATQIARFRRWGSITVAIVYLLILAGSIVRSTGAGMGCPDWPRCFGSWVPPTQASQLPPDYRTRYATQLHGVEEFNAVKTWTEYLNRLLGVATGISIFITVCVAWPYRRASPHIFYLAVLTFLLVGFEGWLGKVVVDTNLREGMVTLHMLVALVIVCLLIYVVAWPQLPQWQGADARSLRRMRALAMGGTLLLMVQIGLGTTVREYVDQLLAASTPRAGITNLLLSLATFLVHRSFSILLVVCAALLGWWARSLPQQHPLPQAVRALGITLVVTVLAGMVLSYLALPVWAQPVHLLAAAVLVGLWFFATLVLWRGQPKA